MNIHKNSPIDVGSFESNIIFRHPITGKGHDAVHRTEFPIDDWLTFFYDGIAPSRQTFINISHPHATQLTMLFVYPYFFTWIAFSAHQYVAWKLKVGYVGNREFYLSKIDARSCTTKSFRHDNFNCSIIILLKAV